MLASIVQLFATLAGYLFGQVGIDFIGRPPNFFTVFGSVAVALSAIECVWHFRIFSLRPSCLPIVISGIASIYMIGIMMYDPSLYLNSTVNVIVAWVTIIGLIALGIGSAQMQVYASAFGLTIFNFLSSCLLAYNMRVGGWGVGFLRWWTS